MPSMIYKLPFLQLKRKIEVHFKNNPIKTFLFIFTIGILLLLMSFIVKEFLSPILEIIYLESDKTAKIQFYRSINLAVSVISSLVLILSIFMGMQEQKEFDKMMQNYQITQFRRNLIHFIFEFLSNLTLVIILISVLIFPSIKTQETHILIIYLMLCLQACTVIFSVLCLERMIRIIFPKILWQITLIFIQGLYYYSLYHDLESWHMTNYFNFMIGDEFKYLLFPVMIILIFFYILNFKSYKEGLSHRIIRFRFLPSTLVFKNFKEIMRHKESTLNFIILIVSVSLIKVFRPILLEDEMVKITIISLTGMQSIYLYAYFKESLILYRFSYQSGIKIYFSYLVALILSNLIQFTYLAFLIPNLLYSTGTIIVTLILVNSIFICLGKFFPLQEKYGFNTSFQLALIVLMIVPMVILLFEVKKYFDLSSNNFLVLQGSIAIIIQLVVIRSVQNDLVI